MHEPTTWVTAAVSHVAAISTGPPLDRSLRVTLNFHPDRVAGDVTTLEAIVRDGVYRSQFETGTSNGGLTAYPGGDRWTWENALFGGAYITAPQQERPKYGALDHRRGSLGGAPRFGSAYLRLAAHTMDRTTFCFPDSYLRPVAFGTADRFDLLRLVQAFGGDPLDGYVEAHVHGVIEIARDAEALVLDPCYHNTRVQAVAEALPVPLEWHEGRLLGVDQLDGNADYRDPTAVELGHRIARDGWLDARIIGDASRTGRHHPQAIKQVWHHTARFGVPRREARGATVR